MQVLPPLNQGSLRIVLPIADSDCLHLVHLLLLDGDQTPQIASLTHLLRSSPSLLLWVICKAGIEWGKSEFSEIEAETSNALFETLAGCLLLSKRSLLENCRDGGDQNSKVDGEDGEREIAWKELTLQSIAATLWADSRATSKTELLESKRISATLFNALSWLRAGLQPADQFDDQHLIECLPSWLAPKLDQTAADSTEKKSRGGIQTVGDLEKLTVEKRRASLSVWQAAQVASQTLLAPVPQCQTLVANLIAKLDRFDQLVNEYNETLLREKLASIKQLAYGASHEVNNPLANISTRAQTLLRDETDPDRRRKLSTINAQAFRAHEMIANLMLFAHPPDPVFESFDFETLVREVLDEIDETINEQGTRVEFAPPDEPILIEADRTQIAVLLKALCRNSYEALKSGGWISISLETLQDPDSDQAMVHLDVIDNGPGMSQEVSKHIFDPFFSGREAGRGLGFGLSKVWRIVEMHGGSIVVDQHRQERVGSDGAEFLIVLPLTKATEMETEE